MNSLLRAANFPFKPTGKDMPNPGESKADCTLASFPLSFSLLTAHARAVPTFM
jgi:hypothetical protein